MGISSRFLPCGQSSVAATVRIIFLPIILIVCIMISVKQTGVAVREVDLITQIWSFDLFTCGSAGNEFFQPMAGHFASPLAIVLLTRFCELAAAVICGFGRCGRRNLRCD